MDILGGGTFHSAGQNQIIENAKTDLICLSQMQDEVGIAGQSVRFVYVNFTSLIGPDDQTSGDNAEYWHLTREIRGQRIPLRVGVYFLDHATIKGFTAEYGH